MSIYPVNLLFIFNTLLLGTFSYNRFVAHIENRSNNVIYRYFLASFFVSMALLFYGLPAFFANNSTALSFIAGIALILNAIGFNHFLLITLNSVLSDEQYILAKHILHFFVIFLAVCMIINPPNPYFDLFNIIHWKFSSFVGITAALHMDIIFILNIGLLMFHFYRLKALSILNSIALVLTFALTGIGGSYQYIGDNSIGLLLGAVALYLGIAILYFSVIRGISNRMLEWSDKKGSMV